VVLGLPTIGTLPTRAECHSAAECHSNTAYFSRNRIPVLIESRTLSYVGQADSLPHNWSFYISRQVCFDSIDRNGDLPNP
jgi:hypothetical protein